MLTSSVSLTPTSSRMLSSVSTSISITLNDLGSFNVIEIDVDTLDNILEEVGVSETLLVSITTNGSENEILSGMARTAGNVRYLATIGEGQNYPLLGAYGFSRLGGDDRGYTYWR